MAADNKDRLGNKIHDAEAAREDQLLGEADHGLEVALDFAIQCSPDHPWLKQHPQWFRRRPDGLMRYAENPPKKYEDIVNPDFASEDAGAGIVTSYWTVIQTTKLRCHLTNSGRPNQPQRCVV